ncbi:hypothetical protein DOTSEDRAFT_130630 [Dothistroma septosporum NZE10]|uniref:Uncharacterized protein n=1 Tax=Dothistroma septosporum (strain NZE10 / CBS 128990) TaxID=675120 RepID=N1PNF9_DOTSN|nr:hypothetical protein DOTSEDRAFT_130630 [Dothistroma septosporum NZE10]
MASRRLASQEKAQLDQDETKTGPKSNIAPAVPTSVITKLLAFTFAMITFPISSYFLSVRYLFRGNSTYAGGFAALIANVVLIAYVVVAFADDKAEREELIIEEEKKKSR